MDKKTIQNFSQDLLFPKFCYGCGREGFYVCQDCWHLLNILDHDYCLCERNPCRIYNKGKCEKCSQNKDNKLSGLYFALSYKDNNLIKKLIHNFKYQPFVKDLSATLASVIAEHFILNKCNIDEFWANSILIPIPIHISKQKERGYNQSEELANKLSQITKIPVYSDILIKTKKTESQMTLKKEQRLKNIQSAFAIQNCKMSDALQKHKKIFLVDDVYTTGSTMKESARVLRAAGCKEIWGITIAREEYL